MTAEQGYNGPAATDVPRPLHRSVTNRVFAGVCGGLAEHFGADASAVRLAAVIVGLLTGIFPLLIAYLVAAIVVPEGAPASGPPATLRVRPGSGGLVFGAILVLVGLAGIANEWLRVDWDLMWPIVLIGLGGLIVVLAARRS